MKRILITGANSYIGNSFEKWCLNYPDLYQIDSIDMKSDSWKDISFGGYDTVFHVAGIAHVSKNKKLESLYYKVNRDLAIETAKKAKKDGVKQFIFMSSIIVYGNSGKTIIKRDTKPKPNNSYGLSKLQAEESIILLQDDLFNVIIMRPPMIYGKGCKGNYPKLAKIARRVPIFPDIENRRSMLHIDNLCEFVRLIIENEERGIFFPQNKEYVKSSEMVRGIAEVYGKKIGMIKLFNFFIEITRDHVEFANKIFGDLAYELSMSEYKENYRYRDFKESLAITEK